MNYNKELNTYDYPILTRNPYIITQSDNFKINDMLTVIKKLVELSTEKSFKIYFKNSTAFEAVILRNSLNELSAETKFFLNNILNAQIQADKYRKYFTIHIF